VKVVNFEKSWLMMKTVSSWAMAAVDDDDDGYEVLTQWL